MGWCGIVVLVFAANLVVMAVLVVVILVIWLVFSVDCALWLVI